MGSVRGNSVTFWRDSVTFGLIPELFELIPELSLLIPEFDCSRTDKLTTKFFAHSQIKGHRLSNKENTYWGRGGREREKKV